MPEVGIGVVPIRPDLGGFSRKLKKDVGGAMDGVTRDVDRRLKTVSSGFSAQGVKAGKGFGDGLTQSSKKGWGNFMRGANQATSSIGDKLRSIGSAALSIAKVGTIGAGIFGGLAIKTAASFEKQMSAVGAVSNATGAQLELLRKKALQLGADTSFSASESALAIEELVKAGISVPEVLNGAADAVVALAAAGSVQLPEAATISANAMNQFNLAAGDMMHVADQIAGVANASAIDVSEFGFSLAQVGAVANLVGLSFDDTALSIAALGNAGIVGSDAGTSLKAFLSNLIPVTDKQKTLFKELGLVTEDGGNKFFDAAGKVKSMAEVAEVLQTSVKGLTKEQKLQKLETLFGSDAIRAAGVIAEEGGEGFASLAADIGKVSAADVAEKRLDNLSGSIEKFKGSLDTLLIQTGGFFTGFLRDVVDLGTKALNALATPPKGLQDVIGAVQELFGIFVKRDFTGVGPWHEDSPIVASLFKFRDTVADVVRRVSSAFAEMVAVFRGDSRTADWVGLWARIGRAAREVWDVLLGVADFVRTEWKAVLAGLGAIVVAVFVPWAVNAALAAAATIVAVAPFYLLLAAVGALAGGFVLAYRHIDGFKERVDAAVSFITDTVVPGIQAFWATLTTGFTEDEGTPVERFALRIREAFDATYSFITDTAIPGIRSAIGDLVAGFQGDTGDDFFTRVGLGARAAWDFIVGTAIPGIKSAVESFISGLTGKGGEGSFFTDLGETVRGFIAFIQQKVIPTWNKFVGMFRSVVTLLKPVIPFFAAIAAAIVFPIPAFIFLYQKFSWFRTVVAVIAKVVVGIFTVAFKAIEVIFTAIAWVVTNVLTPGFKILSTVVGTVFGVIANVVSTAWNDVIRPVFDAISWFVTTVLAPVFNVLLGAVRFAWSIISAVIKEAWEIVGPIFRRIADFVGTELKKAFDGFKVAAAIVWTAVSAAVRTAWNVLEPIFDAVWGFVKDKLTPVWDALAGAVSRAWGAIPGIISGVLKTVGGLLGGFLSGAASIADAIGLDHIAQSLRSAAESVRGWGRAPTAPPRFNNAAGPPRLAAGARIGAGFKTQGPQVIVGEGRPAFPEYVIPTDPRHRKRALSLWSAAGGDLMEDGGRVGRKGRDGRPGRSPADVVRSLATNIFQTVRPERETSQVAPPSADPVLSTLANVARRAVSGASEKDVPTDRRRQPLGRAPAAAGLAEGGRIERVSRAVPPSPDIIQQVTGGAPVSPDIIQQVAMRAAPVMPMSAGPSIPAPVVERLAAVGVPMMDDGGVLGWGKDLLDAGADALGSVLDAIRAVAGGAVERVWPKLDVPDGLAGFPAGGANKLRDGAVELIRGEAEKKERDVSAWLAAATPSGSIGQTIAGGFGGLFAAGGVLPVDAVAGRPGGPGGDAYATAFGGIGIGGQGDRGGPGEMGGDAFAVGGLGGMAQTGRATPSRTPLGALVQRVTEHFRRSNVATLLTRMVDRTRSAESLAERLAETSSRSVESFANRSADVSRSFAAESFGRITDREMISRHDALTSMVRNETSLVEVGGRLTRPVGTEMFGGVGGTGGLASSFATALGGVGVGGGGIGGLGGEGGSAFAVGGPGGVGGIIAAADGGIFRQATRVLVGEAGPEVVIPLSRPAEAAALVEASGLMNVVGAAGGAGGVGGASVGGRGGPGGVGGPGGIAEPSSVTVPGLDRIAEFVSAAMAALRNLSATAVTTATTTGTTVRDRSVAVITNLTTRVTDTVRSLGSTASTSVNTLVQQSVTKLDEVKTALVQLANTSIETVRSVVSSGSGGGSFMAAQPDGPTPGDGGTAIDWQSLEGLTVPATFRPNEDEMGWNWRTMGNHKAGPAIMAAFPNGWIGDLNQDGLLTREEWDHWTKWTKRRPLADGGIFRKATEAVVGEAGPEVVIPLMRPARAAELVQASGLGRIVAAAMPAPPPVDAPDYDAKLLPTYHTAPFDSGGVLAQGWNVVNNTTGSDESLVPAGRGDTTIDIDVDARGIDSPSAVAEMVGRRLAWQLSLEGRH